jgi:hypothetical protein
MAGAAKADEIADTWARADPRAEWVEWTEDSPARTVELVQQFEPLDTGAGHAATRWLREEARSDVFTVTYLLASPERLEGFITCRVSEATLTWGGVRRLGGERRQVVPAYLLCWCAKHCEAEVDGEELLLNAVRLGRELRPFGCVILALDPHDRDSSEKVWQAKHGFRPGVSSKDPEKQPRLWLPLATD